MVVIAGTFADASNRNGQLFCFFLTKFCILTCYTAILDAEIAVAGESFSSRVALAVDHHQGSFCYNWINNEYNN